VVIAEEVKLVTEWNLSMAKDHLIFYGEKVSPLWFCRPEHEAALFLVRPVDLGMVRQIMDSIISNPLAIIKPFFTVVICSKGMYSFVVFGVCCVWSAFRIPEYKARETLFQNTDDLLFWNTILTFNLPCQLQRSAMPS
jgi:hypothetical protein